MASTLNEIAYSITETINHFKVSSADRIPLRFLYKKIADARATIIKNRMPFVDQNLYQHLECLEFEDYQMVCDGFTSDTIIKLIRIPDTMSILDNKEFIYFGADSFTERAKINVVTMESFLSYGSRRYTIGRPVATRVPEGMIVRYLTSCNAKYFTAITVLLDPLSANGCQKLTPDDPYPIPQDYIMELELMVKKDILSSLNNKYPGDFKQNQSDNPAEEMDRPIKSTMP
jgi:hypothetical protein